VKTQRRVRVDIDAAAHSVGDNFEAGITASTHMTASTRLPLLLNLLTSRKNPPELIHISEMPWTGGVPEELVKKLEAKNLAVYIYR
jgi:hypothetical protein